MPCSAAGCCSSNPDAATVSAMTPSCWRRRARRARANGSWISGRAWARQDWRSRSAWMDSRVTLVEIDPGLAALAAENAQANGLAGRVSAVVLDVAAPARAFAAAGLAPESVTRVLMNPPFNDPARQRASPDRQRRLAHAGPDGTLAAWIKTGARLAASGWNPHPDLASGWSRRCPESARRRLRRGDGVPDPFQGRRARDPRSGARGEGQPRCRWRYCRGSSSTTAPASPRRRRNRCCAGAPYCRWVKSDDAEVAVAHGAGRCHSLVRRRARNAAVIRLPARRFRSKSRWDIAAMAPIRTINM